MNIADAIADILADGRRPTARAVRDLILKHDGSAPSMRDIAPALKAWRDRHRAHRDVVRVVEAYNRLDAEQRDAFREIAGLRLRPDADRVADLVERDRRADPESRRRLRREIASDRRRSR